MRLIPKPQKLGLALLIFGVTASLSRHWLALEYHKVGFEAAEIRAVQAGTGDLGLFDRLRSHIGLPVTDYNAKMAYYGQRLMDAGYLSRRDLQLSHEVDVSLFTTNVLRELGGRYSQVWFGSNRTLIVVAQPSRIDTLAKWFYEQDTQKP